MTKVLLPLLTVALMAPRIAAADDASEALRARLRTAQAAVRSYRMQLSSPAGFTGVATMTTSPRSMHVTVASGPVTIEMYLVGGYAYQRVATADWQKRSLPPDTGLIDIQREFLEATQFAAIPDVVDGGVTYGAVRLSSNVASVPGAPSAGPLTITCTYNKTTFLLHACASPAISESFDAYNDPANAVTLPDGLSALPDAGPIVPPASPASPAPAPSATH